ncbi:MAG: hypothetical protein R8M11_09270 [Gallionella sp.]
MHELVILAVLVAVIVLSIRGGKKRLDAPIIIHLPGQYHITLAPRLERAELFIKKIAEKFRASHTSQADITTQFFEVCDRTDTARDKANYWLAIAWRNGTLFFQAIKGEYVIAEENLPKLREYSEAVLLNHPPREPVDISGGEQLRCVVTSVATQLNVSVKEYQ